MPEPVEPCTKRRLMFACHDSYEPDAAALARSPRWIGVPRRIGYLPGSIDGALVGRAEHGLTVAFRGTVPPFRLKDGYDSVQVMNDWRNDLDCPCVAREGYPGKVHKGFAESLDALWGELEAEMRALIAAHPGERLFVTGHSKGAALANLFAWRIRAAIPAVAGGQTRLKVMTFAGPRTGDRDFAKAFAEAGIDSVRYEAQFDVVPYVPLGAGTPQWVLDILKQIAPDLLARPNIVSFDYAPVGTLVPGTWGDLAATVVATLKSWFPLGPKPVDPGLPANPVKLLRRIVAAHAIGEKSDYDGFVCAKEAGCGPGHLI